MNPFELSFRLPARPPRLAAAAVVTLAVGFALLTLPVRAWALIVADTADDVCPANADPCVISQTVLIVPPPHVPPEAPKPGLLDFGTRQVDLIQGGRIDVGGSIGRILCGEFLVTAQGSVALKVADGPSGGILTISARGECTDDRTVACLSSGICAAGGIGSCDSSAANVTLGGRADGAAESPGSLVLLAAGSIVVSDTINMAGTTLGSDGGSIELSTFTGDITVTKPLIATSGREATGGDVTIDAGGSVVVRDLIDVTGGEGDGGSVDIAASGDISLTADIRANANAFDGFGGEVVVDAGTDLVIDGGSGADRQLIRTNGNGGFEGSGGDGGAQAYDAIGTITMGEFVRMEANGGAPDGFGEEIAFFTAGDIFIGGDIETVAGGTDGSGGVVDLDGGGRIEVFSTSQIDATGSGASGTEEIAVLADRGFIHRGIMDISSTGTGTTGNITATVGGDVEIYGALLSDGIGGALQGSISLNGCQVTVASGANITNKTESGANRITAREGVVIEAGAVLRASGSGGTNNLEFRTDGSMPVVSGTVAPIASLTPNDLLLICPVCGNNVVEPGESCEDGNLISGDGCNSDCQDEGCIDQTSGYPFQRLCNDDDGCTVDSCDATAHACIHIRSCDDRIDCTIDSCKGTVCQHVSDVSVCDDGNPCTTDTCSQFLGCRSGDATGACDDGLACTIVDGCAGGVCSGVSVCETGEICSSQTGTCVGPTTTTTLPNLQCGNGVVQPGEQCDAGASNGLTGAACAGDCTLRECGDPNGDARVTASDALFTLRVAVGSVQCDSCICDVAVSGGNAGVTASDALMLLRISVGIPITLGCSICSF